MDRKVRGYTLIEILFVIVLMSILMYIFIKEILVIKNREDLKGTAETLAGNLNFVKSQSIVSSFPNGFWYKDQTKEVIFFADKNRDGNYTSSDVS
ncbi:MAG: type II secretion system protein [Thermodesulfobacteriaceae bacterium]|nr:type II secretion system protein [Thermodesulfobacteriaceae bacterium]